MREIKFLFLSIGLFIPCLVSASDSEIRPTESRTNVVVCERPETVGLYKQCYEAQLLERISGMARVYSLPQRQVITVPIQRIFIPQAAAQSKQTKSNYPIAIPGRFLWNTAPEGYQSLCNLDAISSQSSFLTVSCGRYQGEKILRDHALFLKPITEQ
jgi:hypothetical protein